MKKLLCCIWIVLVMASGCSEDIDVSSKESLEEEPAYDAGFVKPEYKDILADTLQDKYEIEVSLNTDNMRLICSQTVLYVNKETESLQQLVFQIFPNAYKSLDTAPILFGDVDAIYPQGFKPGYIQVDEIQSGGAVLEFEIYGSDETLLRMDLPEMLSPGSSIELEMSYTVQIPPAYDRFGYTDRSINFGNWYPVAAVYDESGWQEEPYYDIGDPFYTDLAEYVIEYDIPRDYDVASTGKRVSDSVEGQRRHIRYEAEGVRDVAWVASDMWNIHVQECDGTTIRSYYYGEFGVPEEKAVQAASDALRIFGQAYGRYPYTELAVAATDFPSGMEYPSMVMIAADRYRNSQLDALENVIVHEIGHQWFYGVVGNDQISDAWLDESLTVFSTAWYFGERYERSAYARYVKGYMDSYRMKISVSGDGVVSKHLGDFDSWTDYTNLVYRKGFLFLNMLLEHYGPEETIKFLRAYYEAYMFRTASTEDFIQMGEQILGGGFEDLADQWLFSGVQMDAE